MSYSGPERRLRQLFTTKNTAYFTEGGRCVAVLDLRSGRWLEGHLAVGRELRGGMSLDGSGLRERSQIAIGDALYFADGERELVTSGVCEVGRPGLDLVEALTR